MKKEVTRHAMVMEKHAFPEHPWAEPPTPIWFKNHASSRILFILSVAVSVQMEDLRGIGVLEDWLEDVGNASEDTFLDLADYMPQAAAEALLSYAAHGILRLPEAR